MLTWIMIHRGHFDPEIRSHVKLKIIHGFWRNDDQRRVDLLVSCNGFPLNSSLIAISSTPLLHLFGMVLILHM